MEFFSHVLPNRLEIAAECNGAAHSAALGFLVRSGARDESDAVAGVSHFLEHMAFKGTPTRSADDVNRQFDAMGAHYNAFTNEENTVYYAAVLPEFQERVVELLGDILRPSLRQEDFDTEKQVILEEIRMYEDQPPFGADEKCRALYYGSHPLGRSVLGTVESVSGLSVEAMRHYFQRRYGPDNIVLVAAGRIDFDALVSSAQRCCGAWQPAEAKRVLKPAAPRETFEILQKPTATQQYSLQLAAAPAAEDADRYAAKILAAVLGDDTGSRLYWELVDPGLAEHAGLAHGEYQRAGVLMTSLSCAPQHTAENLQRILDIYRRAQSDGITSTELDQAKSKIRSRIVLSSERPRGRLFTVGSDWVYRRQYRAVGDELDAVGAVTRQDVASLLSKYPLSRSTTVTIGPLSEMPAPK